jgi:hypothetical protein
MNLREGAANFVKESESHQQSESGRAKATTGHDKYSRAWREVNISRTDIVRDCNHPTWWKPPGRIATQEHDRNPIAWWDDGRPIANGLHDRNYRKQEKATGLITTYEDDRDQKDEGKMIEIQPDITLIHDSQHRIDRWKTDRVVAKIYRYWMWKKSKSLFSNINNMVLQTIFWKENCDFLRRNRDIHISTFFQIRAFKFVHSIAHLQWP